MKTADILRTEIKRHRRPGHPIDTDVMIEAFAAVLDLKTQRLSARITELEAWRRGDEA